MDASECKQHKSHHFALLLHPAFLERLDRRVQFASVMAEIRPQNISNKTADVSLGLGGCLQIVSCHLTSTATLFGPEGG